MIGMVGLPARYGVTGGSGKLVRYDLERGTAEEHSFGTPRPGDPVRPCLLLPIRTRANCPAGTCPMFTTRSGTARSGDNRRVGLPGQARCSSATSTSRAVRIPWQLDRGLRILDSKAMRVEGSRYVY